MLKSMGRRVRHDPPAMVSAIGLGIIVAAFAWLAATVLGAGGVTRPLAALGGGLGMAAAFLTLLALLDDRARSRRRRAHGAAAADPEAPSLRTYDAHPDAPPRRPLSATDLETLEPVVWPSFRLGADDDVLELTTVVPMRSQPVADLDERPTLRELLARLESGVERRAQGWTDAANAPPPTPDHAFREGLGELRQAAAR